MCKYQLVAFGEALIDFVSAGGGLYRANPGGAPYNLAACVGKGGLPVTFIGKIGDDAFGKMLIDTARAHGVDTSGMVVDKGLPTTHAFVTPLENGDNSFVFCRDHGADAAINEDEINSDLIALSRHFHFGGLSLTGGSCTKALYRALKQAVEGGLTISFDPNYRPLLWSSAEDFKRACLGLPCKVDVLKVSEAEAAMLSGLEDLESASAALNKIAHLVLVTLGADGAVYRRGDEYGRVNGYPAKVKDTTGAGDIFFGRFLGGMLEMGKTPATLTLDEIHLLVDKACRFAAKSTEKDGAIPSIP